MNELRLISIGAASNPAEPIPLYVGDLLQFNIIYHLVNPDVDEFVDAFVGDSKLTFVKRAIEWGQADFFGKFWPVPQSSSEYNANRVSAFFIAIEDGDSSVLFTFRSIDRHEYTIKMYLEISAPPS